MQLGQTRIPFSPHACICVFVILFATAFPAQFGGNPVLHKVTYERGFFIHLICLFCVVMFLLMDYSIIPLCSIHLEYRFWCSDANKCLEISISSYFV